MRDIEKMNMAHDSNSRRIRRRKRGRSAYALLVVILTFAIIVTLSMTVFFNIQTVRLTGDPIYELEDILSVIGISEGDNMMRLHLDELEAEAEKMLVNAESVDLKRQFPNTLVIDIREAVPAYNVSYEYGTLIVSRKNKILQDSMNPMAGLIQVVGYVPSETTPGEHLSATEERQDKIFSAFQDMIQESSLAVPITSINMTDLNDIIVDFDHRIEFNMGNWSEINYKISFAEQVIAGQPAEKEGYLMMIGTNQCSFRSKSDVENARKAADRKNAIEETMLNHEETENSEITDEQFE